jgi:DNA-binding protein H-NS
MALPSIKKLSLDEVLTLRDNVDKVLASKRAQLEKQMSKMGNGKGRKSAKKGLKGTKVAAKYRSKQDKSLTWSGRGALPRWMRAEMKGTRLKKDAFLIG